MRGRRLAVVLTLGLFAAACFPANPPPPPDTYVALGDSYTSGPIIPFPIPPYGCLKSDHNYPHLAAPSIALPKFVDISCGGATTDDMRNPQDVSPDGPNPPQFSALDFMTGVVTITIGGNDIGFTSIAENCASPTPLGTPCQDKYVVNGHDELRQRIADTAPKVAATLQGIHQHAPRAKIYILAYEAILPEGPLLAGAPEGCYPQMPMTPGDVPYLRGIEKALNEMIAQQAAANDATFVDTYAASIGHDACQIPTVRWVEPVVPAAPPAPVHPNQLGMTGAKDAFLAAIP